MASKAKSDRTSVGELSFSWDQLRGEIDGMRAPAVGQALTKEQEEFLRFCRKNPNPVSYRNIAKLWVKAGYSPKAESTIRGYGQMLDL